MLYLTEPTVNRTAIKIFIVMLVGIAVFAFKPTPTATYTVTKTTATNDGVCNADCSLPEAIGSANGFISNDVVNFDPSVFNTPQHITLTAAMPIFSGSGTLTINGTGANLLTINANNTGRVFLVDNATVICGLVTNSVSSSATPAARHRSGSLVHTFGKYKRRSKNVRPRLLA